ncbi:hypothetical protein J1N35_013354 [Gossypium stocksii]|uniref:Uncharacterized protein n=1 Tax=Gossypium stocksii TaxID=47602 RepID=A0A9D3VTP3_9ROSI|nr:hypothetical protein J1N35_013354 [Gossypium stocksii]
MNTWRTCSIVATCESVSAEDGLLVLQVTTVEEDYYSHLAMAVIITSTFVLSNAWGGSCYCSSHQYQKNITMNTGKVQILSRNTSSLVDA